MTTWIALGYLVLRVVGRWILREISGRGRRWLLRRMAHKIKKFRGKAVDLLDKHPLRSRWNAGRAHRWAAARAWVKKHWYRLSRRGAKKLDDVIRERIPEEVPDFEDFDQWYSTPEGRQVKEALGG